MPISAKNVRDETKKDSMFVNLLSYILYGWPNKGDLNKDLLPYESRKN